MLGLLGLLCGVGCYDGKGSDEMSVTISIDEVKRAIRIGDGADETAEVGRLLALATIIVQDYAPQAPGALQDEAAIRLIGYLYDQPTLSRPGQYSAAIRNCGMASLLSQYRAIRAGGIGAAPGTGAGGAILPPGSDRGNVSAFSHEFLSSKVTNPSFNGAQIDATGSTLTVLEDQLIPGPIIKDTVLFANYNGVMDLYSESVKNRSSYEMALRIQRKFGADFDKIIHTNYDIQGLIGNQGFDFPLNFFNEHAVFKVGENQNAGVPENVELTSDDLALPHKLSLSIQLLIYDKDFTAYDLPIFRWGIFRFSLFQYQLRQAVATGIDVDLANFEARLDGIEAKEQTDKTELEADIDSVKPLLLPTFPDEGSRNDKIPKFDGDTLGWEVDSGGGGGGSNVPNSPGRESRLFNYALQVSSSGLVSWKAIKVDWNNNVGTSPGFIANKPDLSSYASQTALDATNAALNALDDDVKQNTADIATKAAEASLAALNQEVNRFGTQAEANRVALANLKLPNAPDATSAKVLYELQVQTDGTVTWEVATAPGPGNGLLGAKTTLLGQVTFARADTLNKNSATKDFSTAHSDAIRAFLAKADPRDLVTVFRITFQGDGGSVVHTAEYFGSPVHLPAALSAAALRHFHFNQTYAQVTGDPNNHSRGEVSITVPEAGKVASAVLDVSPNLKASNALRNTTKVDVFVYGREFQAVQESKVPDPPKALDNDAVYELEVDSDGALSWTLAPNVPNLPDAPKTDGSTTKKYELQVADTALVTWVEAEGGGGAEWVELATCTISNGNVSNISSALIVEKSKNSLSNFLNEAKNREITIDTADLIDSGEILSSGISTVKLNPNFTVPLSVTDGEFYYLFFPAAIHSTVTSLTITAETENSKRKFIIDWVNNGLSNQDTPVVFNIWGKTYG